MRAFALLLALSTAAMAVVDYPDPAPAQWQTTAPWSMVGQLYFRSGDDDYLGSGTVIRPSSILTAGHNVYDAENGWSTDLLFRRAAYGTQVAARARGTRLLVLGGYQGAAQAHGANSLRSFATDTAGVIFPALLADGAVAPHVVSPAGLTSPFVAKRGLGYGAEGSHSGNYPLLLSPPTPFARIWGAFYECRSIYVEGGMSGGPLFVRGGGGQYAVAGVIVAGSKRPASGGIRALDQAAATFIRDYLK